MKNSNKVILDLCGGTGSWSKPYKDAGYTVHVITLPFYSVLDFVVKGGFIIFKSQVKGIPDLSIEICSILGILAAPPCTEFSFAKSNSKYPRKMEVGMETVIASMQIIWQVQYTLPTPLAKRTNLVFWALENPFGLLRRYLGHPVLIFNPYDYGDPYQKKTCLWGFFNSPKKHPVKFDKDYIHTMSPNGKPLHKFSREKFSTNSQTLPELPTFNPLFNPDDYVLPDCTNIRAARRAITPSGFAKAFYEANK